MKAGVTKAEVRFEELKAALRKAKRTGIDVLELERLVRRVKNPGLSEEESKKLREGLARCAEYRIQQIKNARPSRDRVREAMRMALAAPCAKDPSKTIWEETVERAQELAAQGNLRVFKLLMGRG
jgi:hypothetical protein